MPPRESKFRINDILESIEKICRYTDKMTFEAFSSDEKTVDAVIRNLEIIGEAAKHIPEEILKKYPNLPWPEMRGIRNVLIHEYFGVSLPILWETTQKKPSPSRTCSEKNSAKRELKPKSKPSGHG
jgi:uncharacterized protein with HEPN domain